MVIARHVPSFGSFFYVLALFPLQDVVESSRDDPDSEPLRFEVGAGEVVGNPLFETMDEAVRGCAIGELIELDASGGEWDPDLLFEVCERSSACGQACTPSGGYFGGLMCREASSSSFTSVSQRARISLPV